MAQKKPCGVNNICYKCTMFLARTQNQPEPKIVPWCDKALADICAARGWTIGAFAASPDSKARIGRPQLTGLARAIAAHEKTFQR